MSCSRLNRGRSDVSFSAPRLSLELVPAILVIGELVRLLGSCRCRSRPADLSVVTVVYRTTPTAVLAVEPTVHTAAIHLLSSLTSSQLISMHRCYGILCGLKEEQS